MNYGNALLSKVIDNNDPAALRRFGIEEFHFGSEGERKAFRFLSDYAEQNRGQAPDYRRVVAEVDQFDYVAGVEDSYEYLAKQIRSNAAKREFIDLINSANTEKALNEKDGESFLDLLQSEISSIKIKNTNTSSVGTNIKTDASKFLDEYQNRKEGKSFKIWESKFPSINEHVGGYLSGNMYTWYGRSGRGKSVFTMVEAIHAAFQGANVLVWAMEMSRFEWMARAYSVISAYKGWMTAEIEGIDYEVGFENKALLMGKLTDEFEAGFRTFLESLNDIIPGNIILRAADDEDFYKRDVKQLESDILQTKADICVIDAIYHMDYETNTSKVAGGDVANTSKKLRRLAGYTSAVIHVITQAEEIREDTDEEGNREIKAPKRAEIKKTKAVLEDATNTFGIDTLDGQGVVQIGKSRNSSAEGVEVQVVYLPNFGYVNELATGDAVASQFTQNF